MSSYNPLPSMNGWNTQITFPLNRGICGFGNLVVISHCKSSQKNEIHLNLMLTWIIDIHQHDYDKSGNYASIAIPKIHW